MPKFGFEGYGLKPLREYWMKKLLVVLFLIHCVPSSLYGQKSRFGQSAEKPNAADYTVMVHISASHLKTECVNGNCSNLLYADAVLNGKKVKLSGEAVIVKKTLMLISPGNYTAKLAKDIHNSDSSLFNQEYYLLLPDNTVWHCFTAGISE
jgi:hypothetical protein